MERYVAIVRKTHDSEYGVEFPDLPGCITAGATLEEAREMAAEALRFHLDGLRDDDAAIPTSSGLGKVEHRLRGRKGDDFYALLEVEAMRPEPRIVRVNITLDEKLLSEIDSAATSEGLTRSGFLAEAARRMTRARRVPSAARRRAARS